MSNHFDAIVIGVGGMGSATLLELAQRGKSVLGIEQYSIPHNLGSSHGQNRIIRLAYYEHPNYVPLLRRSYELWRRLESLSDSKLLHTTGSIDAGPENGSVFQGSLKSCQQHGIAHAALSSADLARRFPGYGLPAGYYGLYQEDGGFLASESCITACVNSAISSGAEVHAHEQLVRYESEGDRVAVETRYGDETRKYTADSLVLTAGAWMPRILETVGVKVPLIPERQVLGWFQPRQPDVFSVEQFPVFNLEDEEERFYGFPSWGVPGFKIGRYHHLYQSADCPEGIDRAPSVSDDETVLRDAVRRCFPLADGPVLGLRTCLFTNSPDGHFVIDRVPSAPNIVFAGGFTGHGFKFCSVVGEILADLITDTSSESTRQAEFLGLARFTQV